MVLFYRVVVIELKWVTCVANNHGLVMIKTETKRNDKRPQYPKKSWLITSIGSHLVDRLRAALFQNSFTLIMVGADLF